jgi:hypothetical protein
MKTLFFDIDGTILADGTGKCKPALRGGALERAIRLCGFEAVICVGNICYIITCLQEMGKEIQPMELIFELCDGAFENLDWMMKEVQYMKDPTSRGDQIDFEGDFYYADDLAEYYLTLADKTELFARHSGKRILVPDPDSTGEDLLRWLDWCASKLQG